MKCVTVQLPTLGIVVDVTCVEPPLDSVSDSDSDSDSSSSQPASHISKEVYALSFHQDIAVYAIN